MTDFLKIMRNYRIVISILLVWGVVSCDALNLTQKPVIEEVDVLPFCASPNAATLNRGVNLKDGPICVLSMSEFMLNDVNTAYVAQSSNKACFESALVLAKTAWLKQRRKFVSNVLPEAKWLGFITCDGAQMTALAVGETGVGISLFNTGVRPKRHTDGVSYVCFDASPAAIAHKTSMRVFQFEPQLDGTGKTVEQMFCEIELRR